MRVFAVRDVRRAGVRALASDPRWPPAGAMTMLGVPRARARVCLYKNNVKFIFIFGETERARARPHASRAAFARSDWGRGVDVSLRRG